MIHCYPKIRGKEVRKIFKIKWDEVTLPEFMNWQSLADKIKPLEESVYELGQSIAGQVKVLEQAILQESVSRKKIAKKKIEAFQRKQNHSLELLDDLYAEGIANFTDIPLAVLMNMDRSKANSENLIGLTDDHFELYKLRLIMLVQCPMPKDEISDFIWQTKSDVELEEMRSRYRKMNWFGKRTKKGKELYTKMRIGFESKYTIRNIWEQTTIANKKFREFADVIVEQLQNDDFSNLANLVALLTVEGNADSEALAKIAEESSAQNYIERYNEEFKVVYEKRVELFTGQKKKMDVATLLKIVNFFLRK